ncbi:MAG: cobalamin-dependent protein, partial [Clostridiales bacterium]|nr:cobalamin-dependent protein [Clostridiales bacterium]
SDVTDVNDPFKMVLGLRRLGANRLENMFCDETPFHGLAIDRQPYIETGVYKMVTEMINGVLDKVQISDDLAKKLQGKKAIIASTDVHEYGKIIVYATLKKGGFYVTDIGCNREPKDVAKSLIEEKPEVLVVSTNNGFALSYAKELKRLMEEAGIWGKTKIFMGGRLNEDAGQAVPVDVTDDLAGLGITPCNTIETLIDLIGATL